MSAVHLSRPLSRRTVLRGLGAAVALPFLDVMRPRAARAQTPAAQRLMFFYVPCGINMATFLPTAAGRDFTLPSMLTPLQSVRDHLLVVSGLRNTAAMPLGDGPGDHARGTGAFLTASHPQKSESHLKNGRSVDQVAAQALRGQVRLPSLELGCENGALSGSCDGGYSCAYQNNIAWASATQPLPKETNPRAVFDRLFSGADAGLTPEERARRTRRRQSVLDFVQDDTARLQTKLGRNDNRKLDEYLSSVRELETRIAQAPPETCAFPERPAGADSNPETYVRQMLDLAVLAMRCDLSRVVSFMFGNGGSNRSYAFLGHPAGHHELSHHQGDDAKLRALTDIGRFEIAQLAYLCEQLKAIDESTGDGAATALDNTAVFFSSEIEDGNTHAHENLPVLVMGGAGGALSTGQHVRAQAASEVGDLFLTLLNTAGVTQASFGEYGTRVMTEILS